MRQSTRYDTLCYFVAASLEGLMPTCTVISEATGRWPDTICRQAKRLTAEGLLRQIRVNGLYVPTVQGYVVASEMGVR